MTKKNSPPDDSFQIRCPKLGHQIHFSYCRKENFGLPCFKALQCWYPHFKVKVYFLEKLSLEEWREAFEKPVKPKVQSLMELIEQAEKIKKEKDSS